VCILKATIKELSENFYVLVSHDMEHSNKLSDKDVVGVMSEYCKNVIPERETRTRSLAIEYCKKCCRNILEEYLCQHRHSYAIVAWNQCLSIKKNLMTTAQTFIVNLQLLSCI
jgi:hypothetical protein